MAWLSDLAGRAENLLNNLDEQTGAALRNHNGTRKKNDRLDYPLTSENQSSASQKRRPVRTLKKITQLPETKPINTNPPRRQSLSPKQPKIAMKESNLLVQRVSSPLRYNRGPDRMIAGDIRNNEIDRFGLKHRRHSVPNDLELMQHENFVYKMQNLEVENAMLKNELNVMNREVAELLDRLRKTEDGNDVVSEEELKNTILKLERTDAINCRLEVDRESWCSQMDLLKTKINNLMNEEDLRISERNKDLELELTLFQSRNKELEDLVRQLNEKCSRHESNETKLENELRHAQTTIQELETTGEKVSEECRRLERDWDAYKLRVKNMLSIKDTEIKSLQEGLNLTEDTKILIDQIETLKEEREELSEEVSRMRSESSEMRRQIEQAEERSRAADHVIKALREALRDERDAKTLAENHSAALAKDLKNLQAETNQTIGMLRTTIRDHESEIKRLREDTVRTPDTSSLNVADYGDQGTIDTEKIHYLTETLVHRQEKIESLLADNNVLRIQMDKMESKYKAELSSLRATQKHSVVNLQDESRSRRGRFTESVATGFARVVGFNFKRYPLFRIFVLFYMMALHFWVLTVLLTSTPDTYNFLKGKNIPIQV